MKKTTDPNAGATPSQEPLSAPREGQDSGRRVLPPRKPKREKLSFMRFAQSKLGLAIRERRVLHQLLAGSLSAMLLTGKRANIREVGTFYPVFRPGRRSRSYTTGKLFVSKDAISIKFKPSKKLKAALQDDALIQKLKPAHSRKYPKLLKP